MTFNFGFLQQFFPLDFFFNLKKIRGNRKARSKRAQCFISALPPPPQHEGEEPACMQANCIKNIKGRERKYTYLYLFNVIFAFLHISKSLIWVLICFCVQLSVCVAAGIQRLLAACQRDASPHLQWSSQPLTVMKRLALRDSVIVIVHPPCSCS